MAVAKSNISYRKADAGYQRSSASTQRHMVFAHKATAGATGFSLSALVTPSEMTTEGFTNPSAAELQRAFILNNRKNLMLISSSKGLLVDYLSYEVSTNDRIDFIGFTADADEIFIGVLSHILVDGLSVESFSDRLGKTERWRIVTSATAALSSFDKIAADTTSAAFAVTLPASPSLGDTVIVMDAKGTFGTNNLTVARNGNNIRGLAEDYVVNVDDASVEFVYVGGTRGWSVRF